MLTAGIICRQVDEEAITLALNGKSTKPEANSRGFGIPTSRKMLVNGLRGKFFMWTGTAFMYQNVEKEEIISVPEQFYWNWLFSNFTHSNIRERPIQYL